MMRTVDLLRQHYMADLLPLWERDDVLLAVIALLGCQRAWWRRNARRLRPR